MTFLIKFLVVKGGLRYSHWIKRLDPRCLLLHLYASAGAKE